MFSMVLRRGSSSSSSSLLFPLCSSISGGSSTGSVSILSSMRRFASSSTHATAAATSMSNRSTIDFGGDAEALRGGGGGKKKQGSHSDEGERLYTIIREPESVVDVKVWLGAARNTNGGDGRRAGEGVTTISAAMDTSVDFEVPMERAARTQLALLSQLSRQRVERSDGGRMGDTSKKAPLPKWMNDRRSIPNYPPQFPSLPSPSSSSSASSDFGSSGGSDILRHPIAVMPDVHFGNGTTVGTVIPTYQAIIPSSVGVDIGCGMLALKTSLRYADLCGGGGGSGGGKDRILANLRMAIEIAVPHGRTHSGAEGNDAGGWRSAIPRDVADVWESSQLQRRFAAITAKYPVIERSNNINHLGTLGTGNHFIEICVEEEEEAGAEGDADNSSSGSTPRRRQFQSLHPQVFGALSSSSSSSSCSSSADAVDSSAAALNYAHDLLESHRLEQKEQRKQRGGHVWIMLHSGSRGVGGKIGSTFVDIAKREMGSYYGNLPDGDLAYLREGGGGGGGGSLSSASSPRSSSYFDDYCEALSWAQDYAKWNRELMANRVIAALRATRGIPKDFTTEAKAVNCHHNYVERMDVRTCTPLPWRGGDNASQGDGSHIAYITRKGATSAQRGQLAIIPGSMGARSYIVQGKGNTESYCSCSHGAGRQFSRGETKRRFTIADHEAATAGVECRKDGDVVDETPMAYKPIDAVIRAQRELVDVVCVLKQVLCVKG